MIQLLHYRKLPVLALFLSLLFLGGTVMGQTTYVWNQAAGGDYGVATNWTPTRNTPAANDILQFSNNQTYTVTVPANQTIGKLQVSGTTNVTLKPSGNNRTLTISTAAADALTVAAGASLTISGDAGGADNLTVQLTNTTGVTASVSGSLSVIRDANNANNDGFFTKGVNATVLFNAGSVYRHNIGAGTIPDATWDPNSTLEFSRGATTAPNNVNAGLLLGRLVVTNNTAVTLNAGGGTQNITIDNGTGDDFVVASGSSLVVGTGVEDFIMLGDATADISGSVTINGEYITSAVNTVTTVSGIFEIASNNGQITGASPTSFIVTGTGTYRHARNGGTVPTATWSTGSTLSVTGMTNTYPAGMTQTFSNVTFASAGPNVNMETSLTVNGNLTISNTGGVAFRLTNAAADLVINVGGDFTMTSGNFVLVSGTGDGTMNVAGNFNLSGGTFNMKEDNGAAALNVDGDFSKSGTSAFLQRVGNTTSTSAVVIGGNFSHSGSGTYSFSNAAAASSLAVAGDFSLSGSSVLTETGPGAAAGNVTFNGGGIQVYTGGAANTTGTLNFTVPNGTTLQMNDAATVLDGEGSFTLEAGATLGIRATTGLSNAAAGHIQVTGTRSYNEAANYLFNGTAVQVTGVGVPDVLSGALVIDNAAGVTLSEPLTINGGSVRLQNGNLVANTPNTVGFGAAIGEIIRTGGTISADVIGGAPNAYNLSYGGASKTVGEEFRGGLTYPSRVRNVTVGLDLGASLTMWAGITFPLFGSISGSAMDGVLNFVSGTITTSLTSGLLLTENASVTGASASRYVNGPLAKVGSTAFTYPVGINGRYLPLAVSGAATVAADISAPLSGVFGILVEPFNANPRTAVGGVFDPPLLSISSCYYWDVLKLLGPASGVHIWPTIEPLQPGGFCAPPSVNNALLNVAHFGQGTPTWKSRGQGGAGVVTQDGYRFIGSLDNIVTFSPFTVGSAEGVLPVTFTSFTGLKDGNSVKLNWETSSEQNSAYFDVERSADGVNYSSIGKVNAAGNSATLRKYSFTDNNPATGRNFYRLRQVDLDAKFEYSKTISVNMAANAAVSIYPNPVQSNMMVEYPKVGRGAIYKVISMDGRVMQSGVLQENSSQQNINLGNLQRGNYILVIQNDGQQYVQKIMKQ